MVAQIWAKRNMATNMTSRRLKLSSTLTRSAQHRKKNWICLRLLLSLNSICWKRVDIIFKLLSGNISLCKICHLLGLKAISVLFTMVALVSYIDRILKSSLFYDLKWSLIYKLNNVSSYDSTISACQWWTTKQDRWYFLSMYSLFKYDCLNTTRWFPRIKLSLVSRDEHFYSHLYSV